MTVHSFYTVDATSFIVPSQHPLIVLLSQQGGYYFNQNISLWTDLFVIVTVLRRIKFLFGRQHRGSNIFDRAEDRSAPRDFARYFECKRISSIGFGYSQTSQLELRYSTVQYQNERRTRVETDTIIYQGWLVVNNHFRSNSFDSQETRQEGEQEHTDHHCD